MRGPSTNTSAGGFGAAAEAGWDHAMGGCESGFTLPDVVDPNIVWATCYGNEVTRWDAKTRTARSVSPWIHTLDSPPTDAKYRCHWTPPLAIDPFDHNTVYYGCQVIFKTSNAGQSWSVISPDLSTQDPRCIVSIRGHRRRNLGQFYGEVVFAIAPSHIQKGLIWAGTDDGKVWYTKDGGGHWNDVTKNIGNVPPLGVVTSIQPSSLIRNRLCFRGPSSDGQSRSLYLQDHRLRRYWTQIGTGIPKGPLSYVRPSPRIRTKKVCYSQAPAMGFSLTGRWGALELAAVRIATCANNLGRGAEAIPRSGRRHLRPRLLHPGRHHAARTGGRPARVAGRHRAFASRAAYRFIHNGRAFVDYSLRAATKGPVQIQITDSTGAVVHELQGPGRPGLNRVAWD